MLSAMKRCVHRHVRMVEHVQIPMSVHVHQHGVVQLALHVSDLFAFEDHHRRVDVVDDAWQNSSHMH